MSSRTNEYLLHFELSLGTSVIPVNYDASFEEKRNLSISFNHILVFDAVTNEQLAKKMFSNEIEPVFGLHDAEDWGRWSNGNVVSFILRARFSKGTNKIVISHSLHSLCRPSVFVSVRVNSREIYSGRFEGGIIEFYVDPGALGAISSILQATKQKAIVVLGMHRSGTSALTRAISLVGGVLPNRLMPHAADNPSGFWESTHIAELNEKLLRSLGTSWFDLFSWSYTKRLNTQARLEIVDSIRQEYNSSDMILIKDPRISLMKPLWSNALSDAGYNTYPIIMVRNPLEVASSLYRRNGLPIKHSLLLWAGYTVAAYDHDGPDADATFISFESLLTNPMASIEAICARVGPGLNLGDSERDNIRSFVREHSRTLRDESMSIPGEFAIIRELHAGLIQENDPRAIKSMIEDCRKWLISIEQTIGQSIDFYKKDYFFI